MHSSAPYPIPLPYLASSLSDRNSKRVKQSPPTYFAGMQNGAGIREKTFANLAGFPGIGGHIERHVNHHWRADNVFARNAAPEAAIVGVGAVVAHREIAIVRN